MSYTFIPSRPVGQRIGIIKAGERGFHVTDHDGESLSEAAARLLVDRLNVRIGVTDARQLAMIAGSAFGFHVPAADPDHPSNTGGTLREVDTSMCR